MIFFFKKSLFLILIVFPLSLFGNSDKKGKCFQVFLKNNYDEKNMHEHLGLIKKRGYPTEVSNSLLKMFNQSKDAGVRGMIGRVLGEYRLARYNRKKIVSLMVEILNDEEAFYLERKGMAQGLGYLLKPTDEIEIKELAEVLNDRSASVRKETVVALGRIKPENEKDIERILIEIATDFNEEDFVREASISALREIISPTRFKKIVKKYKLPTNANLKIQQATSFALENASLNNKYKYEVIQTTKIRDLYEKHIEEKNKEPSNAPKPFGSWSEVRIFLAIHKRGYFVIPQFEVVADKTISYRSRPYRIDLVIIGSEGKKLALEFDGNQHENEDIKQEDKGRQKQIENIGWKFWRIKQRDFTSHPDQTLEKLWEKLDEIEIKPISETKK